MSTRVSGSDGSPPPRKRRNDRRSSRNRSSSRFRSGRLLPGQLPKLAQALPAADLAVGVVRVRQRLEHDLARGDLGRVQAGERFLRCVHAVDTGRVQADHRLLGVPRKGFRQGADLRVVLEVHPGLPAFEQAHPHAHEGVLQDGQLIVLAAEVVEEPIDEPGRDQLAEQPHRTLDHQTDLVVGQARHEVLALVQGFRQPEVGVAVLEVVGAHGEHDEHRSVALMGEAQGDRDEVRVRFVLLRGERVGVPTEDLLELVDQEEEVGVGLLQERAEDLHQARDARGLGGLTERARGPLVTEGLERRRQVRGELLPGPVARGHLGDDPAVPVADEKARLERRDEAGIDQRGLAASRAPDDPHEARAMETLQQLDDLALAAEEEERLVLLEGPKADEGTLRRTRVGAHASSPR